MDTAQWPQEIVVKPIEEIVVNTCSKPPALERKVRPQKEQALNCPRCNSTNTKFCYYNNYSLTQPRYFCKTCRRYWTEGGSLRSIPVGGGSRKNKRSSASSSSSSKKLPDLVSPPTLSQTSTENHKIHEGQDLNLAFPSTQGIRSFSELIQFPSINENNNKTQISSSTSASTNTSHLSALELLTGISSRGLNSFPMPVHQDPSTLYTSGFPLQDFKPTLSFSLDGLGSGYGGLQGVQETNGRLLFPFEDLKQQVSSTADIEQNKEHGDSTGYWTGMLGGGSW
ncbi:hypothetical protein NC651_000936 [Populus alba x Populus x berolinensis]|nr:hypothetical protein NC651_000936 [Populus alba x Populus x berolinensis]